jgi:hypothetical protein
MREFSVFGMRCSNSMKGEETAVGASMNAPLRYELFLLGNFTFDFGRSTATKMWTSKVVFGSHFVKQIFFCLSIVEYSFE